VESFLKPLKLRAKAKLLNLSWSIADNVPDLLTTDPVRIGQVLINLVGNSIKFTSHGQIEVKVEQLGFDNNRVHLVFSVRDTGIGIPEDKQKAIFEPFAQADSSFSRRFGGAGLGLSISERLVTLMGGNIRLESKLGEGSTFNFDLWSNLPNSSEYDL